MMMNEWWVGVRFVGTLTQSQVGEVSKNATFTFYSLMGGLLEMTAPLAATNRENALTEAKTWVAGLPAVTRYVPEGVVRGPIQMVVDTERVARDVWDLVSAGEVAKMLALPEEHFRALQGHARFPLPVLDLATGPVYREDEIREYMAARTWREDCLHALGAAGA